jgi:hypothetical protein
MSALARQGLLVPAALAEMIGVAETTLVRWEQVEGLPVQKVGRTRFYDLGEIRVWLRRQRAPP